MLELINCGIYEAKSVTFDFSESGNPYFVRKHYYPDSDKGDAEPIPPETPLANSDAKRL